MSARVRRGYAHRRIAEAGYAHGQERFEIGGVRMFFVKGPDEMPRGLPLRMGPGK
jgi:hypothetical protein